MRSTMTKSDLAEQIAKKSKVPRIHTAKFVENLIEVITAFFEQGGGKITIRGLGTFTARTRAPFRTMDPRTEQEIHVTARKIITFKSGHDLTARIN